MLQEPAEQAALVKDKISALIEPGPAVRAILEEKALLDKVTGDLPLTRIETVATEIAQTAIDRAELLEPSPALKALAQQNRLENISGLQRFVTTFSRVVGSVGTKGSDFANSPLVAGLGKAAIILEKTAPTILHFMENFT